MARGSHPNTAAQPMPGNVRGALAKRKLMDAFRERPDYQQNDYLKWIATANGVATKQQRLDQMLDELDKGSVFKGEPWTPPAPVAPAK
ncbi:MAG TPA: YdeI/OmpD-associated family protein [Kofleriaceae bacterium]|nr:YdeI/OmpD-associated family protein [Kofleriaceae bacterium]